MTTSIDSGEQGVKYSSFSGTNMSTVYGEGLNVYWPWERMVVYDVRVNAEDEQLSALSSNGATINMDVTVRYKPTANALPLLHTTYGQEYYERLIRPELRSAAREIVGRYTPEELYSTRRNELQDLIFQQVQQAAAREYVEVEAVLIRDVVLPDQVRRAIENKLEEEQRVEQAALSVQRAEQEAERKRVEAQGDADRARIVTQSLTPQFLRWQGIEATRELAQSENAKVVIIGGDGD
ncbi:MAG: prohibitin family protein, partial [Rubricoccaceae bacterium]|nr:prohibitin family protein [Rubricoccaceae bacterium]